MATEPRLLVIDASLNKRISTELNRRGRRATSLSAEGLRHELDPPLLRLLAERFEAEPWVLVTADDNMPAEHPEVLAETGATVATVDPRRTPEYSDDEDGWGREVVHHWARKMATQPEGTIRRYSLGVHRLWTPRRR